MTVAARFLVMGRVQGVFFRASTRRRALELGVHGHAMNLADGRVEVLAAGGMEALDMLEHWLHEGPPLAKVTRVLRRAAAPEDVGEGFFVR